MKSRMEELSDFYEVNIDDPKAFLLEKLRLRLKKALFFKNSPPLNESQLIDYNRDLSQTSL